MPDKKTVSYSDESFEDAINGVKRIIKDFKEYGGYVTSCKFIVKIHLRMILKYHHFLNANN